LQYILTVGPGFADAECRPDPFQPAFHVNLRSAQSRLEPSAQRLTTIPPFAYNKPSYLLAGVPAIAPIAGERPKNTRGVERARWIAENGSRRAAVSGQRRETVMLPACLGC
jgi:hypothetical protein